MKDKRLSHPKLYERLTTFDIDGGTAPRLPFVERLARENGWTRDYAERVVHEYRRFVYLAATGETPVTPSKEVDAAWHLHLTYTRSYWKRLCDEVLGKPLHHEPTRGGHDEHVRFVAQYEATLARYAETFGEMAPEDIWPSAEECFGPPPRTVWKPEKHWIVKKPRLRPGRTLRLLPWLAVPLLLGCAFHPMDLVGTEFLAFIIPLFGVSLLFGQGLRMALRVPAGDPPATLRPNLYHSAWLTGGARALTATAMASLYERKAIVTEHDLLMRGTAMTDSPNAKVDAMILDRLPMTRKGELVEAMEWNVDRAFLVEVARLEEAGMLLSGGRQALATLASGLPSALVFAFFAFPRLMKGMEHGKPVGFLVLTMIVAGIATLALMFKGENRLTLRGSHWLDRQRTTVRWGKRKRNEPAPSVAENVALFGVTALTLAAVPALARWAPPPSTSSASSSCSTGSGCGSSCGGGCGGGGCGGCGGN